jgi:hypothetical protein
MSGFSQEHRNAVQAALLSNIDGWMVQFDTTDEDGIQELIDYIGGDVPDHMLDRNGEVMLSQASISDVVSMQHRAIAITLNRLVEEIESHS